MDQSNACDSIPWKRCKVYSQGVVGLHEEINDFYEVMSPTWQENVIRSEVVKQITQVAHSLWPKAKVEVFGSFKTGLFLPTSDIDIVIIGEWTNLPLHTLQNALMNSGISFESIHLVPAAKVPLVRLVHAATKVKIDISFNVPNGLKGAAMIMDFIKLYPVLPKLLLVLKQFLLCRNLNEVFHGGMSSYCLTLLVISYLQGPHKPKVMASTNLGVMLLEFFELFGMNFNFERVSISIENGGYYVPKYSTKLMLTILDPLNSENDVAKGTYNMPQIKFAFENAYCCLHKAVTEIQTRHSSLLSSIIGVDNQMVQQRHWLSSKFESIYNRLLECQISLTWVNNFLNEAIHYSPIIIDPVKSSNIRMDEKKTFQQKNSSEGNKGSKHMNHVPHGKEWNAAKRRKNKKLKRQLKRLQNQSCQLF